MMTGLIVDVEDILFPSHLRIVHLGIDGTDGLEVLLASISHRETAQSFRRAASAEPRVSNPTLAHHIATIETDGEIIAMLTYLCLVPESPPKDEPSESAAPYLLYSFINYKL